ncbi:transcriptional regulator (plasmid) [Streptomyces sp. Qhu-G9]|uniref:transcriptional regulator n=1 Tax=Streptomyces sp. Qhu-G9 TaxID=3452799 RepID=UPI0022ABE272|nr:transcriptional regulator [Streptomyces aurantiacus]WAU78351.1 transcriptional regulator [Streptomyces aurantiacus]
MPERNIEFGKYGAHGIKGHEAVARQLDALAGYIATPVTARRGLLARLHYLTRTDHARQAARAAGLTVTDRTLRAWQTGTRTPSRRNLAALEQAYRTVRRENVARYLTARLNKDGRGTRVEIHPINQSRVDRPRQRAVEFRTMNVRRWERIVAAWAAGNNQELDEAWVDQVVDLGSQWGQYEYVTNVGFAA